ncbi:hypothetical protein ABFS83_14G196900 [Erythranthe nasuta]
MERAAVENLDFFRRIIYGIDDLGEAVIRNILSRLPAKSFASAACVSRLWNTICNSILSSPKLSSAVSFNPSLEKALNEVVEKVLMEPIRPHFVLASIGPCFILQAALRRIEGIFGSKIPIIINVAEGVIGRDVRTDKFVEVQWVLSAAKKKYSWPTDTQPTATCGMILTVGFLPGLKVHLVPLFQSEGPQSLSVDKFVMDIREVASAFSHSSSPAGIMLFADRKTNILPVLQKTEYAFPKDTFIVGDGGSELIFRISETTTVPPDSTFAAVALLFTRDINKPLGIGEIQFHVMLSTGVTAVGPVYKILSVEDHGTSTCFTATRDTIPEPFEGEAILHDILDEVGEDIMFAAKATYIGVTKSRSCSVGTERAKLMQFHEFHKFEPVGDEALPPVRSVGINSGDPFRFYISDKDPALSTTYNILYMLMDLKEDFNNRIKKHEKAEVFGGIVFCCGGRGGNYLGSPDYASFPFVDNFPGVTFAGTHTSAEIARGCFGYLYGESDQENNFDIHCNLHPYGALYLVMSYHCPIPER